MMRQHLGKKDSSNNFKFIVEIVVKHCTEDPKIIIIMTIKHRDENGYITYNKLPPPKPFFCCNCGRKNISFG